MKKFHVRRNAHWMVPALLLVVAGCGGSSPTGGSGGDPVETTSVTVGNNFFSPEPILVSPGESVTWDVDRRGRRTQRDVHLECHS